MSSIVSPDLRARIRGGAEPIARVFGRLGLTPNMLTLIGFGIAVVAAYLATLQEWTAAGIVVAFGAVFDLFDGALARATNATSRLGAFLDSTFDRLGEAIVYIGVAWGMLIFGGFSFVAFLAMWAMAMSFMVSYTRAKSESLGFTSGGRMASVGLAPREVRLVILVLGLVLAGRGPLLQTQTDGIDLVHPGGWAMLGALALIAVLATFTTVQRIVHVYNQAKKEP